MDAISQLGLIAKCQQLFGEKEQRTSRHANTILHKTAPSLAKHTFIVTLHIWSPRRADTPSYNTLSHKYNLAVEFSRNLLRAKTTSNIELSL